jgi:hypothetical protein
MRYKSRTEGKGYGIELGAIGNMLGFYWEPKKPKHLPTSEKKNWAPWVHAVSPHWQPTIPVPTFVLYRLLFF